MPDWVSIGRVGRSHGLRGAFVVERASDDPARFAPGARIYAEREPAEVVESKRAGGRLVIRLDRPVARGVALELPITELQDPEDDSYYVFQLVGLAVEDEGGDALGHVRDVASGVANDVLELDSGILLPMVEECILRVDLDGGRIVVAPGFATES